MRPGPDIRFPGQYYDAETGLHYNRFRYYDPAAGRYLSADPIGQRAGPHLYQYALWRPLNIIDPLGLLTFKKGVPQGTLSSSLRNEFDLIDAIVINKGIAERVVTSTTDKDSKRTANTRHNSGLALDLRGNDISDECQRALGKSLAEALGPDFDVVSEFFTDNPNTPINETDLDHIHIEHDPKRGKTKNFFIRLDGRTQ